MARIIVLLKDIVDLTEMKVDPETRQPITEGAKRRISDLDKRALEAALKLKESGEGEVIVLSMGGSETRKTLLGALAMGADAAYIINDEALAGVDSRATSKVLKAAVEKIGNYDLIIGGEMALDSLSAQVIPRLAELLGLPQVTYAKEISLSEGTIRAVRDLEDVDEVVEVGLPAVVAVVREINEPRIPSLMNIMKAKRKPTEEWDAEALGLSVEEVKASSSVETLNVMAPNVDRKRIVIKAETVEEAAAQLADAIISEGVLER
ncbi:MAG: electron transfer flavoprotein subunit beta/FixA family protein [Candidatus Bathyarchaeia archaeon]